MTFLLDLLLVAAVAVSAFFAGWFTAACRPSPNTPNEDDMSTTMNEALERLRTAIAADKQRAVETAVAAERASHQDTTETDIAVVDALADEIDPPAVPDPTPAIPAEAFE